MNRLLRYKSKREPSSDFTTSNAVKLLTRCWRHWTLNRADMKKQVELK